MRFLYVTWDSPQVDYLETLFVPILSGLRNHGFEFDVLQFGWGRQGAQDRGRIACEKAGIGYQSAVVSRAFGPIGPLLSAKFGGTAIRREMQLRNSQALLVRGIMPAIAASSFARRLSVPLALDLDGLQLDERVDFSGQNPISLQHRILRDAEYRSLHFAETVIVRTHSAAKIVAARAGAGFDHKKVFVVGNGRDSSIFKLSTDDNRYSIRTELGFYNDAPLLVYAGSYGPQYCFETFLKLFEEVVKLSHRAGLLILTSSASKVRDIIKDSYPNIEDSCRVIRVSPQDVPNYIGACDFGIAFRDQTFSTEAVRPIKLGEYFLCGLSVVGTDSVGELGSALESGVFIPSLRDTKSLQKSAAKIVSMFSQRNNWSAISRRIGVEKFSLEASVFDYAKALSKIRSSYFTNKL